MSSTNENSKTILELKFFIGGELKHRFKSDGHDGNRINVKIENAGKFSNEFTGSHDDGQYPELKSGGGHEFLARALMSAQKDSDTFLTKMIDERKSESESADQNDQLSKVTKKPKNL
mmetsp:Transcript_18506/g.26089  ORF Transcript_18506/g.26089 Transcript_18506/m.26089 type:complete len:117 (-) Transcript_18506:18-368(-)